MGVRLCGVRCVCVLMCVSYIWVSSESEWVPKLNS